jgi:hypothetical protein
MQKMPQQKLAVEEERTSKVNFPFLVRTVLDSICPVCCFRRLFVLFFSIVLGEKSKYEIDPRFSAGRRFDLPPIGFCIVFLLGIKYDGLSL